MASIYFQLSADPIRPSLLAEALRSPACGAYVAFEGWIRDTNQQRPVSAITYEAYHDLAMSEGERLLREIVEAHHCHAAHCVHRTGTVALGEPAVWVGVVAPHRKEAFAACIAIMDALKERVPIWKHEHYADGSSSWLE